MSNTKWRHLEVKAPEVDKEPSDNMPRWRQESAGNAMILNLRDVGFEQVHDFHGITMKRVDDNGLVMYVDRLGRHRALATIAARASFKYLRDDGVHLSIVPSAFDMTESMWAMLMNKRSNSDILVAT